MKIAKTTLLTLAVCAVFSACSNRAQQKQEEAEVSRKILIETEELTGEQRFEDVEWAGDEMIGEKRYHYEITRASSDDLPTVQGDFSKNAQFHDNTAKLVISCGDRQVFAHTYQKKDFAEFVDADMMSRSVLRGFVFIQAKEGALEFGAAVGYPQDDEMFVPILLKVKPDGSVSMEKDTTLDEPVGSSSFEEGV